VIPDGWGKEVPGDPCLGERRTAVLVVPSVVANGLERNVMINPAHKDFAKIACTEPRSVEWHQRFLVPPMTKEEKK
jgi:RES domain-containing protein